MEERRAAALSGDVVAGDGGRMPHRFEGRSNVAIHAAPATAVLAVKVKPLRASLTRTLTA